MKKLLLLLTVLVSAPLFAATANVFDAMETFITHEKKQKNGWFTFEQNFMGSKFDLMKKQHDEMYDHKKKCIQRLKSEGYSEQMLRDELAEKVEMCSRHMDEWKRLCNDHHERGEEMYKEGKAKLNEFRESYLGSSYGAWGYNKDGKGYTREAAQHEGGFLERALEMLKG